MGRRPKLMDELSNSCHRFSAKDRALIFKEG